MKKTVYFCDICNFATDVDDLYEIKVKSLTFVNYANYDMFGANRKTCHICKNCIEDFKDFIKIKRDKNEKDFS